MGVLFASLGQVLLAHAADLGVATVRWELAGRSVKLVEGAMRSHVFVRTKLIRNATAIGVLAACLAGAIDVWTDPSVNMAHLYVLIVVFVASSSRRSDAIGVALLCAVLGVVADHVLAHPTPSLRSYDNGVIPLWNGVSRVVVYGFAALLVSALRDVIRARDRVEARARIAARRVRGQPLLPMCAWCKKIEDRDAGAWLALEAYLAARADVRVSHGICPACSRRHFGAI